MHDIFFFTDAHGHYPLFSTMRDWCKTQDNECLIVYGGDAIDRGSDGYRIIKELLDDPQIIYLYGNHEDLFIKAADAIIGHYAINDKEYEYLHHCDEHRAEEILIKMAENEDVNLHLYNGGMPTLISWLCDGANEEIIDRLRNLPRTFSYENLDFCHAGGVYSSFKRVADAEYNHTTISQIDEETIIWDRDLISYGWETNRICIHGHTPAIYLPTRVYGRDKSKENIHPCSWYDLIGEKNKRGGMKIDMDTGMIFTGRGYVLNCLTFKVQKFIDRESYIELSDSYKLIS